MREYTLRFWLPDGDLYSFSEEFADEPDLERKYVHRMEVLGDGTVTMLNECTGPPETVEAALEASEKVIDVIATGDDSTFFYVHFEPESVTRKMMEGRRKTSLTLNMPLELHPDGSIVGRYVGDQGAVEEAFGTVPDPVESELVRMRSDATATGNAAAMLTARQREVLAVAIDEGYYADPRTATQGDIAAELGLSASTVGEHLRKIEATVLGSMNV